jgi:hypothetical protein
LEGRIDGASNLGSEKLLCVSADFQLSKMSSSGKGAKRARIEEPEGTDATLTREGREQLLLTNLETQTRLGHKFCDESALLPLLLAHGLIRRVRTIQIEVRPLGGDSFKITLESTKSSVGEAKAEIARLQGTAEGRQELYRVAERADGLAVREDDAEPEMLDNDNMLLANLEIVAMAVKDFPPLLWRTCAKEHVTLSEEGAVATQTGNIELATLATTGIELTEGKHYWEVEILSQDVDSIYIGISRPNLNPIGDYLDRACTDIWFMSTFEGALYGNGKGYDDNAGEYKQGDRVGVLLDLDNGSLRFFKNGVGHGPGYAAGSVTGPVVHAAKLYSKTHSVRLLPNAEAPAGV